MFPRANVWKGFHDGDMSYIIVYTYIIYIYIHSGAAMMAKSWLSGFSEQVKTKIQEIWQSLAVSVEFSAIAKRHHHHWGGSKLVADKIHSSVCLRHQQDDSPTPQCFSTAIGGCE